MLWADFLLRTPPNVPEEIEDLFQQGEFGLQLTKSEIQFYCGSDKCKGNRFFQLIGTTRITASGYSSQKEFITYWCKNCGGMGKTFALELRHMSTDNNKQGTAMKFGESPPYGPSVPARLISLIGPDRDEFLKGRRAENQGLGIGAFAYYRRVVENQKGRLITEISKVAKRLNAPQDIIEKFDRALRETQFSKAVDDIKTAIPAVLLIEGHNPLMLLHSALSEGLHAGTDEECLELATNIRLVLTELSERISTALKEESELKQAITSLLNRGKKQTNS
ncbi:MAG TPA: hypothetical protein VGC91_20880 [Pyrinomonadaceae bacterium]|jgi:hypothetical protein